MNAACMFLPFLLSFILFIFLNPYIVPKFIQVYKRSVHPSPRHISCPTSYCGNLTISYPFQLKSHPSDQCGDPAYQLNCKNNVTILEIFKPEDYIVTRIDYNNSEVHIVASSISNGNCSIPSIAPISPSMQEYLGYYLEIYTYNKIYPSKAKNKWGSFMKCKEVISDSRYIPVRCMNKNGTFVYFISGSAVYRLKYLKKSCSYLGSVPFEYVGDNILPSNTRDDVFKLLQQGFILYYDGRQYTLNINPILADILYFAGLVGEYFLVHMIFLRLVLMPPVILAFLAYLLYRSKLTIDKIEKFLRNQQNLMPTRYSYTDIITMTSHFREKLGQGGFGCVFKGVLPGNILVAVKMLGNAKHNGDDFINEVATLGRIYHFNVVRLVGFCSEGSKRALIYEYMPYGSLDKYIFLNNNNKSITNHIIVTLEKLTEIALGIARGIDYLHRGCDVQILHFDIKPNNILLDANFVPKISDFGLAKLYPKEYSLMQVSAARGTIGYIAPELVSRSFGHISHKSDVYSFGMLLMEMVGGRRNADPRADRSSQVYYPSWIYDKLNVQHVDEINEAFDISEMERKLCLVGLWCIQMKSSDRPTMSRVIEMLEANVDTLEMPPRPFFASESSASATELDISYPTSGQLPAISELESSCFEID